MFSYSKIILGLLVILQTVAGQQQNAEIVKVKNENKLQITFGSCNKYEEHQPADIFYTTASMNPDVFIWLGDAAYIDYYWIPHCCLWWVQEQNITNIYRKFNSTYYDKGYQSLLAKNPRILGIYDDHDMNQNDGDKHNPFKNIMQHIYLNFLGESQDSERWNADTLYGNYYIGENKKVKVILLDSRSARDNPLNKGEFHDNIGEFQWKMLEENLLNDRNPELFILGTGYQFIPDDKFIIENWYWDSKNRLYQLLKKAKRRVVLISGDIHYSELIEHPCTKQQYGYSLYELTSSGLSFSEIDFPFVDELRHVWVTDNFSSEKTRYYGRNFAKIQVDLNQLNVSKSTVRLQIYGVDGEQPKIEKVLHFSDLEHNEEWIQEGYSCHIKEGEGFLRLQISLLKRIYQGKIAAFVVILVYLLIIYGILAIFKRIFNYLCKQKQTKEKTN